MKAVLCKLFPFGAVPVMAATYATGPTILWMIMAASLTLFGLHKMQAHYIDTFGVALAHPVKTHHLYYTLGGLAPFVLTVVITAAATPLGIVALQPLAAACLGCSLSWLVVLFLRNSRIPAHLQILTEIPMQTAIWLFAAGSAYATANMGLALIHTAFAILLALPLIELGAFAAIKHQRRKQT